MQFRKIDECPSNPRKKWNAIKDLLHPSAGLPVSTPIEDSARASTIASFFHDKVQKIKAAIHTKLNGVPPDPLREDRLFSGVSLQDLPEVTDDEVRRLLSSMQGKSSPRDFISTTLLKDCSDAFCSIIARLANLSFKEGSFPSRFKVAQITPLIKKFGLDPEDPASYRPISNLNTISKVLERLFMARLIPHVSPLLNTLQSAYRPHHSTETALLKISSDMFDAVESGCVTVLVALDLSAAFDTIDHSVLIRRLQHTFGVNGAALDWLKSYLNGRSCFTKVRDASSVTSTSDTGVPQGSCLGPLLFSLFTTPLGDVITQFSVKFHQYADDTQIYLAVSRENSSSAVSNLMACTTAVYNWLLHNTLALNPDKSDAAMFGTAQRVQSLQDQNLVSVSVAGTPITLTDHIKSLGVTFDTRLSFDKYVGEVCKGCYYHIHGLRHVRAAMSVETANMVACAIIGARLDYCNSLFSGMSDANFDKLQRVQNSLARVVAGTRRRDHITPVLAQLHWLPVKARVIFKIATMVFKIRRTHQPSYLAEMIEEHKPQRSLRSSSQLLLKEPTYRTVTSRRSFRYVAAKTWNSLPEAIRTIDTLEPFRRHVKTFLFRQSYCN